MSEGFNPLISVIIPFFNAEKTLNRALLSISKQTYTKFECILVNNNSTDSSIDIAKKWCDSDSRFKLVFEKKQGVAFAFNTGAKMAQGEFFACMDADDVSLLNRFELQVNFLIANKHVDVVSGMIEYMPHKPENKGFEHYVNWVNSVKSNDEIRLAQFIESPIVNPSVMWCKGVGHKHGLYRHGDFPEDYEMYLRWLQHGVIIEKIDSYVLKWYDSDTRLTRTNKQYSNDAFYRIKSKYLVDWLKCNNPYHPRVVVWGASKLSRQHASYIDDLGAQIEYYIDVNKNRKIGEPIMYFDDMPTAGQVFVLVYLKHNLIREKIRRFLIDRGYIEGVSFIFVS